MTRPWHLRMLRLTTWAYGPTALALATALAVDDTEVAGERRWIKPLKFAVSIGLNGAATLWLVERLPATRTVKAATAAAVAMLAGEEVLIVLQAARGVRSHFNDATAFDAAVFSTMGGMIMVAWGATLTLALVATRNPPTDPVAAAVARLGGWLVLLGASVGFVMVAAGKHAIGVSDADTSRLPLVGWSTAGGDLRVAHFVGLHGLQLLIAVGWALGARKVAPRAVVAAATATAAACVALTVEALTGTPVASPSTLLVVGAAAAAAGGAFAATGARPLPNGRPAVAR